MYIKKVVVVSHVCHLTVEHLHRCGGSKSGEEQVSEVFKAGSLSILGRDRFLMKARHFIQKNRKRSAESSTPTKAGLCTSETRPYEPAGLVVHERKKNLHRKLELLVYMLDLTGRVSFWSTFNWRMHAGLVLFPPSPKTWGLPHTLRLHP